MSALLASNNSLAASTLLRTGGASKGRDTDSAVGEIVMTSAVRSWRATYGGNFGQSKLPDRTAGHLFERQSYERSGHRDKGLCAWTMRSHTIGGTEEL